MTTESQWATLPETRCRSGFDTASMLEAYRGKFREEEEFEDPTCNSHRVTTKGASPVA